MDSGSKLTTVLLFFVIKVNIKILISYRIFLSGQENSFFMLI